jgi:hypothetical protein
MEKQKMNQHQCIALAIAVVSLPFSSFIHHKNHTHI